MGLLRYFFTVKIAFSARQISKARNQFITVRIGKQDLLANTGPTAVVVWILSQGHDRHSAAGQDPRCLQALQTVKADDDGIRWLAIWRTSQFHYLFLLLCKYMLVIEA